MDILVDYLTFSSKELTPDNIINLFGLSDSDLIETSGRNGWYQRLYFNGISIFYGERDDIGVEMSGTGCRTVESLNNNRFNWVKFLRWLNHQPDDINISRLDIAGDEQEGILSMDNLYKHTYQRKYISRARSAVWMNGNQQEIIFGASTSKTRLRIYNKALERGQDGHWIRVEFQFRDKAADSFINNLMLVGDIGSTYSGVLLNYLRYTKTAPDGNGQHSRIETTKWWSEFCGTSEKIKNFTVGGLEYNKEKLDRFIKVQCGPSLRAFVESENGDLTKLLEIVSSSQLNKKQIEMLSKLQLSGGKAV